MPYEVFEKLRKRYSNRHYKADFRIVIRLFKEYTVQEPELEMEVYRNGKKWNGFLCSYEFYRYVARVGVPEDKWKHEHYGNLEFLEYQCDLKTWRDEQNRYLNDQPVSIPVF